MNDAFVLQVLEALVTGYVAREGMKDRFRSLNEYEIARRSGVTAYSYVEYDESAERVEVRRALSILERQGLVSFVRPAGRYDAFAPTEQGERIVVPSSPLPAQPSATEPLPQPAPAAAPQASVAPDPVLARLDEIIRLLRSIERKLDSGNTS